MKKIRHVKVLTAHIESRMANLPELKPLHDKHYKEISNHRKYGFELSPSDDEYKRREKCGQLLHIVLRHEGEIVGYLDGFINRALHYNCLTYIMDIIYVSKEMRGQYGAEKLLETLVRECKRRGVKQVLVGYKDSHKRFLPKIYEAFGFKHFDHIMALWL